MDRLLDTVRRAVAGGPKRPHPGPAPLAGETSTAVLLERFTIALELAAGRVVRVSDEAAAQAFLSEEFAGRSIATAEDRPDEESLATAEVGVDRADLLLAETGTVLRSFPDRAASWRAAVPAS